MGTTFTAGTVIKSAEINANFLEKLARTYTTTLSSGVPLVLNSASNQNQVITGVTAQTITMPDVTTLGALWYGTTIYNASTAVVTINSSGGNLIYSLPAGGVIDVNCILLTGTTAASWFASYYPGISTSDIFTNKDIDGGTASNTSRFTVPKATKATLDGLTRKAGTIWYGTDTQKLYIDNGTILVAVGSGAGTKNYISGGDAESGTTGFATYADAAGTTPVDGTGGAPVATWTTSAVTPLESSNSFLLTKGATNRQGDGVSYDFTIDAQDKAKVLNISFKYLVSSGTFAAGTSSADSDVTVYIYDKTNGVLVGTSSKKLLSSSTTIADVFRGTFQTASNSTSYRLIFHIGSTSASAYTLQIDDIQVSPSSYSYGTPITDWATWNPTGTWVSNTTYTGKKRRVGDSYEYEVYVLLSGAPTATQLDITLDATIDSNKMATTNGRYDIGLATLTDNGVTNYLGRVGMLTTTTVRIISESVAASFNVPGNLNATTPVTWGSGDYITAKFSVPIVGLSGSVQMSDQADTRVVSAYGVSQTPTGSLGGAFNVIKFGTVTSDTHGLYNTSTGLYTVNVPGWYLVTGVIELSHASIAAGNTVGIAIGQNGTMKHANRTVAAVTTNLTLESAVSGLVLCNAGDTIGLYSYANGTTPAYANSFAGNSFSIVRQAGPNQIAANESLNGRFYAAANLTGIAPNNSYVKIPLDTKDFDTHGCIDTTNKRVNILISGTYLITGYIPFLSTNVLANTYLLALYKNGSLLMTMDYLTPAVTTIFTIRGSALAKLTAGDYIEFYVYGAGNNSASTLTIQGTTNYANMTFQRVGN